MYYTQNSDSKACFLFLSIRPFIYRFKMIFKKQPQRHHVKLASHGGIPDFFLTPLSLYKIKTMQHSIINIESVEIQILHNLVFSSTFAMLIVLKILSGNTEHKHKNIKERTKKHDVCGNVSSNHCMLFCSSNLEV